MENHCFYRFFNHFERHNKPFLRTMAVNDSLKPYRREKPVDERLQ